MAADSSPTSLTQDEQADIDLVVKLMAKGKKAKSKWCTDWDKWINYYNGDAWSGRKRPSYRASPNANIIRPVIQTILPIMTDTSPGIDAIPAEPSDYEFAQILSKAISSWWEKQNMQLTIVDWIMDSLQLRAGFCKVVWDPDANSGAGEITCPVIDPRNILVPEGATDFDKKCPWAIEMYPSTVDELKRKYPEKAEFIKASGKRSDLDKIGQQNTSTIYLVSPTNKDEGMRQPNVFGTVEDSDIVWCAECWIEDYATEEIDKENEDGTVERVTKRKYPLGKIIQCIPDLKVHLATAENPYKDGEKPYVKLVDTRIPREFWGEGEIQPLVEAQDMINKCVASMIDYQSMMSNPVWIVDIESGVDPDQITNQIGAVIPKNRGTTVERVGAPSLPPEIMQMYSSFRELADTQSGVHDVTQGRKPAGITAAEAINSMQEAAQTRIRLKERNMQTALSTLGRKVVSRMMQYYRTPRVTKITGKQGWPEMFEWFVEDSGDGGYVMNHKKYDFNEAQNGYTSSGEFKTVGPSKGVFDIDVISGTSLPFQKAQRGNLAMKLFENKAIDQQGLLDTLDWPNKEQLIQRMQKNAQMAAQAQAQAQAQGAPQPGQG